MRFVPVLPLVLDLTFGTMLMVGISVGLTVPVFTTFFTSFTSFLLSGFGTISQRRAVLYMDAKGGEGTAVAMTTGTTAAIADVAAEEQK